MHSDKSGCLTLPHTKQIKSEPPPPVRESRTVPEEHVMDIYKKEGTENITIKWNIGAANKM